MSEENKQSESITIKKETLWKYSTFILAGLLVIGAFMYYNKDDGSLNGQVVGNQGNSGNVVDEDFDWSILQDASAYPSIGPSDAKVVVAEVSDFQCPFCALASGLPDFAKQSKDQYPEIFGSAQKVEKLAKENKIKFIYVSAAFLGAESKYAAEAGLCANEQQKFFEMHDAIFTAHDGRENNGKYNKDKLKQMASEIKGIDTKKFNDCIDTGKYSSKVELVNQQRLPGFEGTPTFYVNGIKASGSWAELSSLLENAGVSV